MTSKHPPGSSAWRRARYEETQQITKAQSDETYMRDCMETMTRYIVSQNKVVAQIEADDLEWLRIFYPGLKEFGFFK